MRRPEQARAYWFIKEATRKGQLIPARFFSCVDCNKDATDYDHYLGYADVHIFDVEPVCRSCHWQREFKRGNRKPPILHKVKMIGPRLKDGRFIKRIYKFRPVTPERREVFRLASQRYRERQWFERLG